MKAIRAGTGDQHGECKDTRNGQTDRSPSEGLAEDQKTTAEPFGRSRSTLEDEGKVLQEVWLVARQVDATQDV